jgi:surfactin synthase thioesterase subunit
MSGLDSLVSMSPKIEGDHALVCVPQGGSGANAFYSWGQSRELADAVVWAAQLPGRENRIMEPPLESIEEMAELLVTSIINIPAVTNLILFGHCSGALVAYEMAHRLNTTADPELHIYLAVSAQRVPVALPEIPERPVEEMSTAELASYLREGGGTAEEVLDNEELMGLLAPAIRADIKAAERYYDRQDRSRLDIPVIAFGGKRDPFISTAELRSWRGLTSSSFELHLIDGDHFFLNENYNVVLKILADILVRNGGK